MHWITFEFNVYDWIWLHMEIRGKGLPSFPVVVSAFSFVSTLEVDLSVVIGLNVGTIVVFPYSK